MLFLGVLLLACMPSLIAESKQNGSDKKILAVQQVSVVKKNTELIRAVKAGNVKVVKNLLKNINVYINELDADNKTALDVAVEYQHKKIILVLAKAGGKVTTMDNAEYVNTVVTRSASNISKGMFFSLTQLIVAVCIVAALVVGGFAVVMAGAMSTCGGSYAGFNIALGILCCVGLPLAYLGVRMIRGSVDSLSGIKNNNIAELYIL